ncbi:MAG: hypothetical protein IJW40_07860 [Clostridia bacterium]|nr:hypothetical protein [Clostridia bacterium]
MDLTQIVAFLKDYGILIVLLLLVTVVYIVVMICRKRRQEYEMRVAALVAKYKNNPVTVKAAENFAVRLIEEIKNARRSPGRKEVVCNFELYAGISARKQACCDSIYCHGIGDYIHIIDFYGEHLRTLQSKEEMYAFVRAVAWHALNIVRDTYKKDESGTDYLLDTEEFLSKDEKYTGRYQITVNFIYFAKNGYYQEPKAW